MPLRYKVILSEPPAGREGTWCDPRAVIRALPESKQNKVFEILASLGEEPEPPNSVPLDPQARDHTLFSRPARETRTLLVSEGDEPFLEVFYVIDHKMKAIGVSILRKPQM